jgi:hypothetical protein
MVGIGNFRGPTIKGSQPDQFVLHRTHVPQRLPIVSVHQNDDFSPGQIISTNANRPMAGQVDAAGTTHGDMTFRRGPTLRCMEAGASDLDRTAKAPDQGLGDERTAIDVAVANHQYTGCAPSGQAQRRLSPRIGHGHEAPPAPKQSLRESVRRNQHNALSGQHALTSVIIRISVAWGSCRCTWLSLDKTRRPSDQCTVASLE